MFQNFLYLAVKVQLFPESLDLGLSLAVAGETPVSLLVHFDFFTGHCTPAKADIEQLASCLNSLKSTVAFSSETTLSLHLRPSMLPTGMLRRVWILKAHCCWRPVAVNKLTALLLSTSFRQSLQTLVQLLDAISSKQRPNTRVDCYSKRRRPTSSIKPSLVPRIKPSPLEIVILCL